MVYVSIRVKGLKRNMVYSEYSSEIRTSGELFVTVMVGGGGDVGAGWYRNALEENSYD